MRIIAFIEDPDVMKKILKHLALWDVRRKPLPVANAPPIDVFPAYDEQPGPSTDDYTTNPRITLQRPIFKNTHSCSQTSYIQNSGFLANLQQNAFLTIRSSSDIWDLIVGCRAMIVDFILPDYLLGFIRLHGTILKFFLFRSEKASSYQSQGDPLFKETGEIRQKRRRARFG